MTDAVSLACSRVVPDHELVCEFFLSMHEQDISRTFIFDIYVPCIVRWAPPWFSAPTKTSSDLVVEGRILENCSRVVDVYLGVPRQRPVLQDEFS